MKKLFILSVIGFCAYGITPVEAQNDSAVYAIIPRPLSLVKGKGFFPLSAATRIIAPEVFRPAAGLLREELHLPASTAANPVRGSRAGIIRFERAVHKNNLGREGYHLIVSSRLVRIIAAGPEGAVHGLFTLLQLQQLQRDPQQVPCVEITDRPRFAWRGMHLDVSRHFFPVSFVEKFIDMMALYKFNVFHWHLTDGPGWRLQIKKYPKLTSEAAWRTSGNLQQWWAGDRRYSAEGDPDAYGGYYTQEQAREVVAYAARRGITVIPEIEMPAHSEEVLAAYPQLSCSGLPYKNSEFCIGNDSTFTFLEDVLTEVMAIFPSKYIHIGGDEASKTAWKTCPKCQKRMKEEGLKNVDELQSYAVRRIEKFLDAHGRKLLGWDEILEGGLAPEATVMSWRGEAGGIAAARQNHDVVMTPGAYCYFDNYQSDPNTQPPAIGGYLPIDKVYRYDPVPEDSLTPAQQSHILGVQANLWSEYFPTTYQVEYMAFPRMLALAEVGWTAKDQKSWEDFHRRLQDHYLLLQRRNINYYRPSYRVHAAVLPDTAGKRDRVSFITEQFHPEIRYTTDGGEPGPSSPVYSGPFYTRGKTVVRAAIFKNGRMMDSAAVIEADYHRAIGKKVIYNNKGWSSSYPAQGAATLTNGVTGSLTYSDRQWQGFLNDVDVTVDMDSTVSLNSLSIRFMQLKGPGVFMPGSVSLSLSDDGKNFTPAGKVENNISPQDGRLLFKTFSFDLRGKRARYLRVYAPNVQGGFMFTDEIIVY